MQHIHRAVSLLWTSVWHLALMASARNSHNGDLRLVGNSTFMGRVEVFYNGEWGTICDDEWDFTDGTVACRQLGFQKAANVWQRAHFGRGKGRVWMDDVRCSGSESRLANCVFDGWGMHECDHGEDASLECADVRLADGLSNADMSGGRVEVFHNGNWGTVCGGSGSWTLRDASVVCRQLNFDKATATSSGACSLPPGTSFPSCFQPGKGTVWLSGVSCSGSETALRECPANRWGIVSVSCHTHNQDVGVVCNASYITLRTYNSSIHGNSSDVLVFFNGLWERICDKTWSRTDARVACSSQQLGEPVHWGMHSNPKLQAMKVALSHISCYGNEQSLLNCMRPGGWHDEDAARCQKTDQNVFVTCSPLKITGVNDYTGVLSMQQPLAGAAFYNVCGDAWNAAGNMVVCRQLGFTLPINNPPVLPVKQTSGRFWRMNCSGKESSVQNCNLTLASTPCSSLAQVACGAPEIRLQNSSGLLGGRTQIYFAGQWGIICDDRWDRRDAQVVCRQLGFGPPTAWAGYAQFGAGQANATIWLDEVTCRGHESNLGDCLHHGWGRHDCEPKEAASVVCASSILIGGQSERSGMAELAQVLPPSGANTTPQATWYQLCADGFTKHAGNLLCYSMEFELAVSVGQATPKKNVPLWAKLTCKDSDKTVKTCTRSFTADCPSGKQVQLSCDKPVVQLVEKTSTKTSVSGVVEIQHHGVWGAVGGSYWDLSDATVLCGQLGYGKPLSIDKVNFAANGTRQKMWMNSVQCSGNETYLWQCGFFGWNEMPWTISQAVVTCSLKQKSVGMSTGTIAGVTVVLLFVATVVGVLLFRLCRKAGPDRCRHDSHQSYTGLASDDFNEDDDDELLDAA